MMRFSNFPAPPGSCGILMRASSSPSKIAVDFDALLALAGTEPRPLNHVNDVDEVCRVIPPHE